MAAATLCACGGRLLARGHGGNLESVGADGPGESAAGDGGIREPGANEVATTFGDNVAIDGSRVVAHSPG
jgi:hypothetical protein